MESKFYKEHYKPVDNQEDIYYKMFFHNAGKILDIGCSTGNFVIQDKENIIGLDIDQEQINVGISRGLVVLQFDVNHKLPFKEDNFDSINCRHIIEHLDNPKQLMEEMYRVLCYGGKIILMTPDIKKVNFNFWNDYTHQKPFTKESLRRLAIDTKFQDIKIYNFSQGVFGMRKLYKFKLVTPYFIKILSIIFGKYFGTVLILEARK